jgi:N-acetylglutamate synthase-like GNAT family acetyltransferase
MNTITVRKALISDEEEIKNAFKSGIKTLRKIYRPNQKTLENRKRINRDLKRFVAIIDKKVIGTVQYYIDNLCMKILGLSVLEDYRKQGVSRKLFEAIEELAKEKYIPKISLYTVKETGNGDIFKKLGFTVVSEKSDEFSESDKYKNLISLYMEKEIKTYKQ